MPERSWAFVTFEEPDSMTECIEKGISVHDNQKNEKVDLWIKLPWGKDHGGDGKGKNPSGAMKAVARLHKTRRRWATVAGSVHTNRLSQRAYAGPDLGDMLLESTRRKQAEKRCCFFLPHGTFRICWDIMQVAILLYVALVYPVRAATQIYPVWGSLECNIDICIDLWFWADIVINFRTAFKTDHEDHLEVDLRKIAQRYVCGFKMPGGGWFVVDLISSLPINYVMLAVQHDGDRDMDQGPMVRLLKGLRIVRLARLLRLARMSSITRQYEDTAVYDWIESLKVLHMALLMLWLTHITACVWYYTGTVNEHISTDYGADVLPGWVNDEYGPLSGNNRTSDRFRTFLMALHAVNPKMYDINDAVAGEFTTGMLIMAIVLETLGLVLFGVVIGSMTTYISNGKANEQKYKQQMDTLHDFFRARDIPYDLRKNVRMFYDNLLRKKTVFDEKEIVSNLPPALGKEVVYALYAPIITNVALFIGLEDEVVTKLCMLMAPFHVVAGTVIAREAHQGREVYIVVSGEVLISRGGVHIAVIGRGESFGEMSALGFSLGPKGNHRDKTATAVTDVDTLFVTGQVLYELMEDYESLRVSLRKVVEHRITERRKRGKAKSRGSSRSLTEGRESSAVSSSSFGREVSTFDSIGGLQQFDNDVNVGEVSPTPCCFCSPIPSLSWLLLRRSSSQNSRTALLATESGKEPTASRVPSIGRLSKRLKTHRRRRTSHRRLSLRRCDRTPRASRLQRNSC